MILTVFDVVEPEAFLIELNALICFLLLMLNVNALTNYCRNAGNPYINDRNKKYVRKYKFLIIIWNFAFILKFFFTVFGVTILDLDENTTDDRSENDFWYSLETFVNIMFTEIIPFYFILDKKIVKIFTLNFLDHNIRISNE